MCLNLNLRLRKCLEAENERFRLKQVDEWSYNLGKFMATMSILLVTTYVKSNYSIDSLVRNRVTNEGHS